LPHLKRLTLTVVFIVSPVVSLSRVSPSLLHLLALRYRKPACATLAASLTMAHCLVQLNSYTISALSLAHHSPISSPPPASIAAGTRHESKSQACGSREVNVRTQQSANACKVSGRAVTSLAVQLSHLIIAAAHVLVRSAPPIYRRPQSRARRLPCTVGKERGIYRG
jgi:hypothetical protein